jgi:hypothetical protein
MATNKENNAKEEPIEKQLWKAADKPERISMQQNISILFSVLYF